MGFVEAIKTCFQKYITFSGRASRSEYWYFFLFTVLAGFVLGFIEGFILGMNGVEKPSNILASIFSWAIVIPSISVMVRRLHDKNRSGWWYFIAFTIIGLIPLCYWFCTKGTEGDNRFGPDPL